MAAQLDFTQPALSVLLAQINYDQGTTITPDQVRVEQVASLPSTDTSGLNSIVFLAATQNATAFEGQDWFKYNRIDISTVPGTRSTLFTITDQVYLSDLLPLINSAWSLNLTAADIQDGVLPAIVGATSVSFMLTMASGALLWLNEVEISIQQGGSSDGSST
jgi:hypothetical protein